MSGAAAHHERFRSLMIAEGNPAADGGPGLAPVHAAKAPVWALRFWCM